MKCLCGRIDTIINVGIGKQKVKETIAHPIKLHIWGCVTLGAFEAFHVFENNLNSERYKDI
jgi:hypothetical protein